MMSVFGPAPGSEGPPTDAPEREAGPPEGGAGPPEGDDGGEGSIDEEEAGHRSFIPSDALKILGDLSFGLIPLSGSCQWAMKGSEGCPTTIFPLIFREVVRRRPSTQSCRGCLPELRHVMCFCMTMPLRKVGRVPSLTEAVR